jgi:nucleotide-binding universal stress UspA family protein
MDFSEAAKYALARAVEFARGGEFHVVHVIPTTLMRDPLGESVLPPNLAVSDECAWEKLEKVCVELTRSARTHVAPHLLFGDVVEGLAGIAGTVTADVVVIGANGPPRRPTRWHRSLAARLLWRAPCSVLTVHPKEVQPKTVVSRPRARRSAYS